MALHQSRELKAPGPLFENRHRQAPVSPSPSQAPPRSLPIRVITEAAALLRSWACALLRSRASAGRGAGNGDALLMAKEGRLVTGAVQSSRQETACRGLPQDGKATWNHLPQPAPLFSPRSSPGPSRGCLLWVHGHRNMSADIKQTWTGILVRAACMWVWYLGW